MGRDLGGNELGNQSHIVRKKVAGTTIGFFKLIKK